MTSYAGRHAELYDLFYGDKPYSAESAFVNQCLKEYSTGACNRILEIACGTGSHAFVLEKAGYQIVATDHSEAMLHRARQKAKETLSRVDFQIQDMSKLNLNEDQFDAVLCLFDSIGYVATNESLEGIFQGVHKYLRPNGLFVFEFWHAGAMLRHYDPVRIRRWKMEDAEVLRLSETKLDYARQLSRVTYSIYELRADGTYSSLNETQINRYFLVQEMAAWLTRFGFKPLKWFAGFTSNENISDDTWHIVTVAQRI